MQELKDTVQKEILYLRAEAEAEQERGRLSAIRAENLLHKADVLTNQLQYLTEIETAAIPAG